jgi:hypothetical protein
MPIFPNDLKFQNGTTHYRQETEPASPQAQDEWLDTTLSSLFKRWYWDGTDWLSLDPFLIKEHLLVYDELSAAMLAPIANQACALQRMDLRWNLGGATDASNYWNVRAKSFKDDVETTLGTGIAIADQPSGWGSSSDSFSGVLEPGNFDLVTVEISPVGSPPAPLEIFCTLLYRIVRR